MIRIRKIALAAVLSACAAGSIAGPSSDALSLCLSDNTSGRDRKDLAAWLFIAIATHPEIKSLSNISPDVQQQSFQKAGAIVTRLLGETCATQTKRVVQDEGPQAVGNAFKTLGALAMQELMANPEVQRTAGSFEHYLDLEKLKGVLQAK